MMKMKTRVLILGAGHAGIILQNELYKNNHRDHFCLERQRKHNKSSDYVVFTKKEFEFTSKSFDVLINRYASGSKSFCEEYSEKLYNKDIGLTLFSEYEKTNGYYISSDYLLSKSNVYGNINVIKIDVENKIAYGKVIHLNEDVEVHYDFLISTLPLNKFSKMCGINLLKDFNIFLSYFPIGIKKISAIDSYSDMIIDYYSDPNIPFYRKQTHGKTIFYEYCINDNFDHNNFLGVIKPGKFLKIDDDLINCLFDFFNNRKIFLVGRNATWCPDFLLDHIVLDYKPEKNFQNQLKLMYEEIL